MQRRSHVLASTCLALLVACGCGRGGDSPDSGQVDAGTDAGWLPSATLTGEPAFPVLATVSWVDPVTDGGSYETRSVLVTGFAMACSDLFINASGKVAWPLRPEGYVRVSAIKVTQVTPGQYRGTNTILTGSASFEYALDAGGGGMGTNNGLIDVQTATPERFAGSFEVSLSQNQADGGRMLSGAFDAPVCPRP